MGTIEPSAQPPSRARPWAGLAGVVSAGAYVALFLLGLLEGVLGSFQYSRAVLGGFPAGAIAFALGILVTCVLAGWAMRGLPAALLPAIGWFVASFVLAMPNSGGSVIIASGSAGEWYLYGGSVGALLGVASAFVTASRRGTGAAGGGRNGPAA